MADYTAFELKIITPEKSFFEGQVTSLVIPTPDGQIGILKGHIPMVSALDIGVIQIKTEQGWKEAFISQGFVDVRSTGVRVFAQAAEWPEEIDLHRAQEAEERILERMRRAASQREYAWSTTALARARVRLRVKGHNGYGE